MQTSDAADQVVRYTLDGVEIVAKLTGAAAKNAAVYLAAVLKDQRKTRGKTHITRMLKDEKPLRFFQVPTEQLKQFAKEARHYGVLFVAMRDRKGAPTTDVMVFAEDAVKINRLMDRLSLAVVDTGAIETEIVKGREEPVPFGGRSPAPSGIFSRTSNTSERPAPEAAGKRSVRGAAPFGACAFVKYNGLTAEQFVAAWFFAEFVMPEQFTFQAENTYVAAILPALREEQRARGKAAHIAWKKQRKSHKEATNVKNT